MTLTLKGNDFRNYHSNRGGAGVPIEPVLND